MRVSSSGLALLDGGGEPWAAGLAPVSVFDLGFNCGRVTTRSAGVCCLLVLSVVYDRWVLNAGGGPLRVSMP